MVLEAKSPNTPTATPRTRFDNAVSFSLIPEIRYFDAPLPDLNRRPPRSRLKMTKKTFEQYEGNQITDEMLREAAQLFSKNYGVWGTNALKSIGPFAKPGSRVKMTGERLRSQCLPSNAESSYVKVVIDNQLTGNAFACRWKYNGKVICWVTQLVVDRNYRERGLATGLLSELKRESDDVYGILTSHAAACLAAAKTYGRGINNVQLTFISDHGQGIIDASPIRYIREAKLRGSLFSPEVTDGTVSCVDTSFFVDHTEPLEALECVRDENDWPLGELIDGHEFLLIIEARRRFRSKSRSPVSPVSSVSA